MRPGRHRRRAVSWLLVAVVLAVAVGTTLLGEGPSPSPPAHAPTLSGLVDDVDTQVSARRIAYQVPTSEERRAAAAVFAAVASGESGRAAEAAADIGYEVLQADADGEAVIVLRDRPDGQPRGWGLYVFAAPERADLVVEIPHPVSDRHTAGFGTELFLKARAQALLLAGAHRDDAAGNADVAHESTSIFEAGHRELLTHDRVVLQIHGFEAAGDRPFDAVVSSGGTEPSAEAEAAAAALTRNDIRVCLFGAQRCDDLGGTTNVQGDSAARAGASFVHLELALGLREPGLPRERTIEALSRAFGG